MRFPAALVVFLGITASAEDRPYHGKYASEPECRKILEELPRMKAEAARAMSGRLGLEGTDSSNIDVQIVDLPLGPSKEVKLGGTTTLNEGGRVTQLITLNLETEFGGGGDFAVELAHETAHALMRNALGEKQHAASPKWVREGLAVWAAGQGPGRAAMWISMTWDKPDPVATLLNGLENGSHSVQDYPEDYFAIASIESAKGIEGVRAFVRLLVQGVNCHDAAATATGLTWDEFEKSAKSFAEKGLRAQLGESQRDLLERAMTPYRETRDWEAAQRGLFAVASRFPESWAGAIAMYYFARALEQAGNFADASVAFLEFLTAAGPRTGLIDDALWNVAICNDKLGDTPAAIAACDRIARDFSYSPQAPMALLKAAQLCEAAGRVGESRARYERIVRDLPKSKEAAEAAKRLGP